MNTVDMQVADVIPPWKGRPDRECPVCSEPEDKPHAPDCEYAVLDSLHLPGMENSRLNAMDWRQHALEERLGTIESFASAYRLNALEERLSALEDWADIELEPVDDTPPDSIHNLIAEGMTGVTTHCMESAAALVTVLGNATDKRIDAVCKRADVLQELVFNIKARLDALENHTPC